MNLKKIKKLNFFKEQSLNNLLRIVLSSFLTISFFYITPILLMFSEKNFNIRFWKHTLNFYYYSPFYTLVRFCLKRQQLGVLYLMYLMSQYQV